MGETSCWGACCPFHNPIAGDRQAGHHAESGYPDIDLSGAGADLGEARSAPRRFDDRFDTMALFLYVWGASAAIARPNRSRATPSSRAILMQPRKEITMGRCLRQGTILSAILVWIAVLTGCGTVQRSYHAVMEGGHEALRWVKSTDDDLIKKVGVHQVNNWSGYTAPDFETVQTRRLAELLQAETKDLIIIPPGTPEAPELLTRLPRTPENAIDNLEVALQARKAGLNALVVASLIDVRDRRQEKGLWWFKDVFDEIEMTINVEVYDSQTAAKILDERFIHRIEADMPLAMPGQPPASALPLQVIEEIEEKIWPDVVRRIVDEMVVIPWVGFIQTVSDAAVTLTAGAESGLEAGDVLDVFDSGRIIEGVGGGRFLVPGAIIGEIEVASASPGRIEARILSGDRITPGLAVTLKTD